MTGGTDLLVVGGGLWGMAAAWRCAEGGARVRVIHDEGVSAGSVAAGMLGPWSEAEDGQAALNAMLRAAAQAWPDFADRLAEASGADPGYLRSGAVLVAARPEHIGAVRHRLTAMGALGSPSPWLSGSSLRAIERGLSPRVAGGADLPDEHQVDPRRLLAALRDALHGAGVEVVHDAATAAQRHVVELASGRRLRAGRVLIASGWTATRLSARVTLRPVKGQILRLGVPPGGEMPIRRVVRTPSVYLVPRADGELVVGATSEEASDRRVSAGAVHGLLDEAIHVVPDVRELELREAAAGLRPTTTDGLPVLGEDEDGVLWAAGGSRDGVLMTPSVAEAIAELAGSGVLPGWALPFAPRRFGVQQPQVVCASR